MPQPRKTSGRAKQRAAAPKSPPSTPRPQRAATPTRSRPARANRAARQDPPLPPDLIDYFHGQGMIDLIVAEHVPDDASAGDVLRLLLEARRLGADPIRGDVYLARGSSRDGSAPAYAVAARRDTLLAYAHRQPGFLGTEESAIFEHDTFERGKGDPSAETLADRAGISHTTGMPGKRGPVVGAWCVAGMEGKPLTVRILEAAEFVGTVDERAQMDPDDPKRLHPDLCVIAAAMSNALRIATSLNDVVGADELHARRSPVASVSGSPPIFAEGPRDSLDERILTAHARAQELDRMMWPAAKVRARLASCHAPDGDPTVYDEHRRMLAGEIELDGAHETVRRTDPDRLRARLAELFEFDASTLDAEDLAEYLAEKRAITAALEAFDAAAA